MFDYNNTQTYFILLISISDQSNSKQKKYRINITMSTKNDCIDVDAEGDTMKIPAKQIWECARCTSSNKALASTCVTCGNNPIEDWKCFCSIINPITYLACAVCGTTLSSVDVDDDVASASAPASALTSNGKDGMDTSYGRKRMAAAAAATTATTKRRITSSSIDADHELALILFHKELELELELAQQNRYDTPVKRIQSKVNNKAAAVIVTAEKVRKMTDVMNVCTVKRLTRKAKDWIRKTKQQYLERCTDIKDVTIFRNMYIPKLLAFLMVYKYHLKTAESLENFFEDHPAIKEALRKACPFDDCKPRRKAAPYGNHREPPEVPFDRWFGLNEGWGNSLITHLLSDEDLESW
jgi:hypothetical protein